MLQPNPGPAGPPLATSATFPADPGLRPLDRLHWLRGVRSLTYLFGPFHGSVHPTGWRPLPRARCPDCTRQRTRHPAVPSAFGRQFHPSSPSPAPPSIPIKAVKFYEWENARMFQPRILPNPSESRLYKLNPVSRSIRPSLSSKALRTPSCFINCVDFHRSHANRLPFAIFAPSAANQTPGFLPSSPTSTHLIQFRFLAI